MKLNNKIMTLLLFGFMVFGVVGCSNNDTKYTNFQKAYFSISEQAESDISLKKDDLENLVGVTASDTNIGENEGDGNSYLFEVNDETLLILTDAKTEKVSFLKYEKVGDITLVNSLEEGTDVGGYKPGYTSQYNSNSKNEQKSQLDLYLNNANNH